MTQEEKQLLLIDLSERLPYGVMCKSQSFKKRLLVGIDEYGCIFKFRNENREIEYGVLDIEEWKVMPYLRPMSSMTEKENNIYEYNRNSNVEVVRMALFDWLNEHHFDYRGLIEKGLAIEAPEGMYSKQ